MQDPESRRAGYPDRAGRSTARAPRLVAGLFDETQDLDAVGIVAAALVGQRDTPRGSAQQRHADGLFELPKMPRDGRLTDAELARDRRQAPALGDADEAAHALEKAGDELAFVGIHGIPPWVRDGRTYRVAMKASQ